MNESRAITGHAADTAVMERSDLPCLAQYLMTKRASFAGPILHLTLWSCWRHRRGSNPRPQD
jgi:hypothetical protein